MTTDQDFVDLVINQLQKGRVVFTHSPERWSQCTLSADLLWMSVRFTEDNQASVPSDQFGVYAFMLEPDFVGPPMSAYLLYIGQTGDTRGFRRRYGDYLYYQKTGRRVVISRMLKRWDGHISFYYAPVADVTLLDDIEDVLLNTCIPPYNDRFKGRAGSAIMAFRRESGG